MNDSQETMCFEVAGDRRAPKAGYNTDPKAQYRESVWDHLQVAKTLATSKNDKILIMPSREGLEIDVAIKHGIKPENILCIDQSAALIANSPWRRVHPKIAFMACDVAETPERAAKKGWRIVSANLDLCGNFSEAMVQTVKRFWDGVKHLPQFYLGLTVAKGREGSAIAYLLNQQGAGQFGDPRLSAMLQAAQVTASPRLECIATDTYTSGRVPMAWCVVRFENEAIIQAELRAVRDRLQGAANRGDYEEGLEIIAAWPDLPQRIRVFDPRSVMFHDMLSNGYTKPAARDYLYAYEVLYTEMGKVSFTDAAWYQQSERYHPDRPSTHCGTIDKEELRNMRRYEIMLRLVESPSYEIHRPLAFSARDYPHWRPIDPAEERRLTSLMSPIAFDKWQDFKVCEALEF